MYQRQLDSSASVARNVQRRILQSEALLYAEPELLLRMELRDPGVYQSVLQAVADGLTKHNEIAGRIGKPATSASPYLATLERLRLLERVAPIPSPQGKRSLGHYFIRDPFLRFWCRFVQPNRSLLELGEAQRVWRQHIGPQLDEYLGAAFEAICREYTRRYGEETTGVLPAGEVGRFWSRDAEIDLLCRNADGTCTCGECKWTRRLVSEADLNRLHEKSAALPSDLQEGLRYVLFSRAGFTDALRHRATEERVTLVDLEDLYGAR